MLQNMWEKIQKKWVRNIQIKNSKGHISETNAQITFGMVRIDFYTCFRPKKNLWSKNLGLHSS